MTCCNGAISVSARFKLAKIDKGKFSQEEVEKIAQECELSLSFCRGVISSCLDKFDRLQYYDSSSVRKTETELNEDQDILIVEGRVIFLGNNDEKSMFDDRKDFDVIVQDCGDVFMRLNPELRKLNVEEIKLKPHFPAAWYIEFYPVQFDCVSKSLNFDERDHVHGNIIG